MSPSSRIASIGERELVRRIARWVGGGVSVIKGIGDDCAVLKGMGNRHLLFASDMLVERVHFTGRADPSAVGWKALAVNISDVAAMGGVPRYAVVSLGLPPKTPVSFAEGFYRGLLRCGRRFGVRIVGGDTGRSQRIVIDVAILGEAKKSDLVYRSGARLGDQLLVTGRLGGSFETGRHLRFTPRLKEARALVESWKLSAMMDLSDGLKTDLDRLCEASGVGARIYAAQIPARKGCSLTQALTDGEDFELLIAISGRQAPRLIQWADRRIFCGLTRIGEVTPRRKGSRVRMVALDGTERPLPAGGFEHFA